MKEILEQFNWWAVVDILLISVIIYHVLLLIKGTKTAQILTGIMILLVVFLASSILPLTTLNWVMNKFYSSIILILVILFQDDIRHGLSRIGKKSFISSNETISSNHLLEEIIRASMNLASKNIGALIVLERNIILSRYIDIGTLIDAKVSKEILLAIFHPTSPVHDGAVIIQQGRIAAAGCFLPLTRENNLAQHMGTRHRAAIGISQETDAVVVLVSEERGSVSLAVDGNIQTCGDDSELRKLLLRHLVEEPKYTFQKTESEIQKQPTQKSKITLSKKGRL